VLFRSQAEKSLFIGDYEQARRDFQNAQLTTTDSEIEAAAAMGMGRALYLQRNYSTAIETLNTMVVGYPDSPHTAAAYYFLARSYEAQDLYSQAADAYGRYLELRPGTLDAYIQDRRGDAYMAASNFSAAAAAYDAAINAPQQGSTVWTQLKLGKAYAAQNDFSNAIKIYLAVYETSDNDYARAQANLLMGQAYLTMGMPEQAHARFLDSVALFPRVYDTYSGLVQLVNDGVLVDEVSRGVVDYYAGQYGLAIDAFNRYLDSAAEPEPRAYYFRGLSYMAKGEAEAAINDFDFFINNFPTHDLWASAWDEKAYLQWAYLERYQDAANTLLQYIAQVPESPKAAEFMFMAARIQERGNLLAEAAATWEQAMEKYPAGEMSYRGLFLAGITYYRLADYTKSLTVFQRYLVLANNAEEQSAAYLWIGKSHQAAGDPEAAKSAWEQGAQLDPTGYYSERANELLQGREPFTVTQPVDLGYDLDQERQAAETWMRSTFALSADLDLTGLGDLASDARVQRGLAFWELGLYNEARDEFESVRQSVLSDPVSTYRLMNQMLELGLYRSAILASRQVLDLANLDDVGTLKAPAYFNHIRFGAFFKDQVIEAAQAEGLHPLFLFSVLRQESLFEGFAISGAGARGLMQIMPATGQEIASSINWPEGFTEDDLYRPHVSITLGARYLARQRDYFGNSTFAALAAYNGGPGNTIIWNEMSNSDPDLLLEVIRADETRKYIIQIYEFFNIYRILYERGM
jgi:soluble lytic murein transglycosylase